MLHEAWSTWKRRWAEEVERDHGLRVVFSSHRGILIVPHLPEERLARLLAELTATHETFDDRAFVWSRSRGWYELTF